MKRKLVFMCLLVSLLLAAGPAGPVLCVPDPNFAAKQANKHDGNAPLYFRNYSGQQVRFDLTYPYWAEYTFIKDCAIILNTGTYKYVAWVGKEQFSGSFTITNGDKHALRFYAHKVRFPSP